MRVQAGGWVGGSSDPLPLSWSGPQYPGARSWNKAKAQRRSQHVRIDASGHQPVVLRFPGLHEVVEAALRRVERRRAKPHAGHNERGTCGMRARAHLSSRTNGQSGRQRSSRTGNLEPQHALEAGQKVELERILDQAEGNGAMVLVAVVQEERCRTSLPHIVDGEAGAAPRRRLSGGQHTV